MSNFSFYNNDNEDHDIDHTNICINDYCMNDFNYKNSNIIKPSESPHEMETKYIVIDSRDCYPVTPTVTPSMSDIYTNVNDNKIDETKNIANQNSVNPKIIEDTHYISEFIAIFYESIKDIVEIELISAYIPTDTHREPNASPNTIVGPVPNPNQLVSDYVLMHIENISLPNYRIATNNNLKKAYAKLHISNSENKNIFFGRIKAFTNVLPLKKTIHELDKLQIKFTDYKGDRIYFKSTSHLSLTFAVTCLKYPSLK